MLDKNATMQESQNQLTEFIMDLIDAVGQFGVLSADGRSRALRLRLNAEDVVRKSLEESRKEELAKRKFADKKAKLDQIAKLSPEEQRKFEEKERKKEFKKNQAKMSKRGKTVKM